VTDVRRRRAGTMVKFLVAGLPAFCLAVPLNYVLVEHAGIGRPTAYAVTLVVQVTINFFLCRAFVFPRRGERSIAREFVEFSSAILGFRAADWLTYVALVEGVGLNFLVVQVANVAIFAFAKYVAAERIFRYDPGTSQPRRSSAPASRSPSSR
jgi:putative flippase GtrA